MYNMQMLLHRLQIYTDFFWVLLFPELEEYLELLLLVTVLSNDIYYKKVLIENLIGNFAQLKKDRDKKNKEKEKEK